MSNWSIPYKNEREGQIEFFDNYRIPYYDDFVLVDNTDGVYNGNIFEFKLTINDFNKVLFQAIKYLSKMRIKGQSVPATILLIDLNKTTVYVYKSKDYFEEIHKVYTGAASKYNEGFAAGEWIAKYNYSNDADAAQVKKILLNEKEKQEKFMSINIDENCIVGWAERYYRENPKANKGDFLGDEGGTAVKVIGEIRKPRYFKYLINPYRGGSNEKFKYLMDCLNDRLSKKDLGAFYTPMAYAKKAAELVQMAVDRVPKGNDYIILDRCAGTGNLEQALIDLKLRDKNGDYLIAHCVVSTYEYYEYKVLQERIGDKVREIIPPLEANVEYENGKVANADAMSEEYINNPIIRKYVDNPKCTIILFENPPYQDNTAVTFRTEDNKVKKSYRTESFVSKQYKISATQLNESKASARELSNLFIWSGFNFYIRKNTDSYIIFSPVKYFKSIGICKKKMIKGFIFNRKYFHAAPKAISCILWSGKEDIKCETWKLDVFDCKEGSIVNLEKEVTIKMVHNTFVPFFDKREFIDDEETNVWCKRDASFISGKQVDTKSIYNDNILGVIGAPSFSLDGLCRILLRQQYYRHGFTFYLRSDNYLEKLPLFVAKSFSEDKWYEKGIYNTTSDGGDKYTKDNKFLKSCLIYACLSDQNKCISFDGSDGRRYQNELCFDARGEDKLPLALEDLNKMELDEDEKELLSIWDKIMKEARGTKNYNSEFNYGVYQITKELNTFKKEKVGSKEKIIYDYPELNGDLNTLRCKLKEYYKSHITKKMFKYELLK